MLKLTPSVSRCTLCVLFFFQAEDGIRDLVRSRGLGDVYKRQTLANCSRGSSPSGAVAVTPSRSCCFRPDTRTMKNSSILLWKMARNLARSNSCLLYTSDAADERSSVDLGGRRIIKKKKHREHCSAAILATKADIIINMMI